MSAQLGLRNLGLFVCGIAGLCLLLALVTIGSAHRPPYIGWWVGYLTVTGVGLYRLRWWGAAMISLPVVFAGYLLIKRAIELAMTNPVVASILVVLAISFALPLAGVIGCRSALKSGF